MKKLLLNAVIITSLMFGSCDKESDSTTEGDIATIANRYYIYYAHWDEWGRSSRNCAGWGLCNFDDCWFCDVDNRPSKNQAKVIFDKETGEGHMYIELKISDPQQADAINNESKFYIDEDIEKPNSILLKGVYDFQPEIGKYGGYKLAIKVKL